MDGTFEDSGDDQHQGISALKGVNAHDVVQIELNSMTNDKTLKFNICTK